MIISNLQRSLAASILLTLLIILTTVTISNIKIDSAKANLAQKKRRVLILGLDGTTGYSLDSVVWEKNQAPNLRMFMGDGQYTTCQRAEDSRCARAHRGPRSDRSLKWKTGPGWASVLTGLDSSKHRVADNDKKDLLAFAATTKKNPSFLKQLKNSGFTTAAAGVSAFLTTSSSEFGVLDFECADATNPYGTGEHATSSCNLTHRLALEYGDSNRDLKLKKWLIEQIQDQDTQVIMGVFDQIDSTGHSSGFDFNNKYLTSIYSFDQHLGEIIAAIEKSDEEWLVIVTADHGGHTLFGFGNHDRKEDKDDAIPFAMGIYGSDKKLSSFKYPVYHMDVHPTVLKWFDLAPTSKADGTVQGI